MKNLFGSIDQFSVAIIPPIEIINEIALFKERLFYAIGNYKSKNSEAHISLNSFQTDFTGEEAIKIFLKDFTDRQSSFPVKFNRINSFPHSFFIEPDENSNILLNALMRSFHKASPKFKCKKYYKPHITIGRHLNPTQIKVAFELINSVNIDFQCNNVSLRKKRQEDHQFRIVEQFWFD